MTDTKPKVSLKLFIDKENHRVIFAETGKNFIDFLFNLLTLPLGTVTQIVTTNAMMGGIGNLYKSVECLKGGYFLPENEQEGFYSLPIPELKNSLLRPSTPELTAQNIPPLNVPAQREKKFYSCSKDHSHANIAENPQAKCTTTSGGSLSYSCGASMSKRRLFVSYESVGKGYVKDEVVYMVADDLTVEPLTTTSVMLKINSIKNEGSVEEKVVYLDKNKALKLLKASLQSKEVLTNVFLSEIKRKQDAAIDESQNKDALQALKSSVIVSAVIVAVAGAIFAITKKLKEK